MTLKELEQMLEDIVQETVTLKKGETGLLAETLAEFLISDLGVEVEEEEAEEDDEY